MANSWIEFLRKQPKKNGQYFVCLADGSASIMQYDNNFSTEPHGSFGYQAEDGWFSEPKENIILWKVIKIPEAPKLLSNLLKNYPEPRKSLMPTSIQLGHISFYPREILKNPISESRIDWMNFCGRRVAKGIVHENISLRFLTDSNKLTDINNLFKECVDNSKTTILTVNYSNEFYNFKAVGTPCFMKYDNYDYSEARDECEIELEFAVRIVERYTGLNKKRYEEIK